MILVAAFLLLVALGLLAGGLAQGSAALQWGSFAASALAALALGVGELRRRRAGADDEQAVDAPAERERAEALVSAPAGAPTSGTSAPATSLPGRDGTPQPPVTRVTPAVADTPEAVAAPAVVDVRAAAPEPAPPATGAHAVPEAAAPVRGAHAVDQSAGPATGAHAGVPTLDAGGEPPVEEVQVTDLLLVLDLTDEVLVVDEHPRYHLAGCPHLAGVDTIPVPMDEARTDGFTPCGTCAPDRNLAHRERARRTG